VTDNAEPLERLRSALASRYRIVREIGRGGMASVYLADDLRHDRRVAVKVLAPGIATALGPQRFLREIQFAAGLAHPHILPLHDSGEADGLVFYVMPFVEGETLRDRLTREKQLSIPDAVRIVREVADGLAYAHTIGIVHRDIKPENILFMGGHAVIADFGVATAIGAASGTRITEGGIAVGTPEYMSPEQATGDEEVDGRSDQYSLACVLYEMLAGDPPFTASGYHALLAKKLGEPVPSVSNIRDTVPESLDTSLRRALAKIPADRFNTVADFAAALDGAASRTSGSTDKGRSDTGGRRVRRAIVYAAGAIALFLLAIVAYVQLADRDVGRASADTESATSDGRATVAVLPFENLGRTDDEYFTAGVTDEITSRLSAVSGLAVVPSRAARRYADSDRTMRDIGRALNSDHLVVGSVRWAGADAGTKSVRVTIELLRAADEQQIWSKTYDRVIDDIFAVQSDIASEVATRLGITLVEGERGEISNRPTENHEAYHLYLKGKYFWEKRTEEDLLTALSYFQQAVDLDPGYSLAWVGIANAWISRGWYSRLAPNDAFPKAKHAALRAIEFDSTLAEAHASLAHIHFEYDHDWQRAERAYLRSIQLKPGYAVAHHWYGGFLSAMGRHEDALQQANIASKLDPLSLIIQTWMGLRYYFAGNHETAIAEYVKALELDSQFAPAHWHMAWAYDQAGRSKEAVASAERAVAIDKQSLLYLTSLGQVYARAGMKAEARSVLGRLERAAKDRHVSAYHLATIHIALGDMNAGLDWLERAYEERSPWIGYLGVDPRIDPVRRHPRFNALLRKARLPAVVSSL
jgi:TolB-like protein/Tfp pilus assembly protein PilF